MQVNEQNRRTLLKIGLCRRAGALVFGTNMTVEAVRSPSKPALVLYTGDASDNTKKKLTDACAFHHVKILALDRAIDGETLAKAIGKTGSVSCVGITNEGLARTVVKVNNAEKTEKADNDGSAGGATI